MATINGTSGADTLNGTASADQINGLGGNDTLSGGNGNDTLSGDAGNDTLYGDAGNDTLRGGAGADVLDGGSGTDIASYSTSTSGVSLNLKTGIHTGDAAGDTFFSIERFTGTNYADTFASGSEAVTFDGGSNTDTVDYSASVEGVGVNLVTGLGSGGDAEGDRYVSIERVVGSAYADTLTSSTSGHTLVGEAGNDVYVIGDQGVVVTEAAWGGDDEIRTTINYTMADQENVERLTFIGGGSVQLTGNAGDNIISGGAGNDTLRGGGGADVLNGGDGTDYASYSNATAAVTINLTTGVFTGEAAGDTFISIERISGTAYADTFVSGSEVAYLDGSFGFDTIDYSTSGAAVDVNLETGLGSGGDAQGDKFYQFERAIGSDYDDTLTSSTSGHTLVGGAGDDVYVVGDQGVNVTEAAWGGDDEIRTTEQSYSIANLIDIERLTFIGFNGAYLIGNDGDNVITGGAGNDTLRGGAGADVLNGGDGVDYASYYTGVTVNLKTGIHTGDAAGDTFVSIEGIRGSDVGDTFVSGSESVILDGGYSTDTVDYSTSAEGVDINLIGGIGSGGDAEGDRYVSIERVVGSAYADTLTSSTSGHILVGGAGDDVYVVGDQGVTVTEAAWGGDDEIRTTGQSYSIANLVDIERLTAIGGDAQLTGNAGDNIITGGAGNDTLRGGGGADVLNGGNGIDYASYSNATAAVTINLKTGAFTGEAAGDTFISIERISGTAYADTFVSGSEAAYFDGSSGSDTIDYSTSGAAVNVNLITASGTGGDAEGDKFYQIERVIGSDFDDTLTSSTSGHTLVGGAGDDVYVVGNQDVTVTESAWGGDDEIRTSLTTYTMANQANVERLTYTGTGSSAVALTGNASDNIITSGNGNDILVGGAGADVLIGGLGTDIASYSSSTIGVSLNLKTGVHTGDAAGDTFVSIEGIRGSSYGDTFVSGSEFVNFDGSGGTDTVDYSTSGSAINISLGAAGATTTGSGGDAQSDTFVNIERIVGSAFDDTLASSTSGHVLAGGAGNDLYIVGTSGITLTEAVGAGVDEVRTTLTSYTLGNDLDNLTYTGTSNFAGNGNNLANVITSQGGVDTVYGYAGNDTFIGGDAGDFIYGGDGSDTSSYYNSNGAVFVDLQAATATGAYAQGDVLNSIENLIGSSFEDTLTGNAGANRLSGLDGVDTISGNAGDDWIDGGAGADIISGGDGIDTLSYGTSNGAVSINLISGVHTGAHATGDVFSGIETIAGSSYGDTFVADGTTTIRGGSGDDIYIVDVAGGTIVEDLDGGIDTLQTSLTSYTIQDNIEQVVFTGTGSFTVVGNAADNHLTGGVSGDALSGGLGDDVLVGGSGADMLDGGDGNDTSDYSSSTAGVVVNLIDGTGTGGNAEGDTLTSIEQVIGSAFNDTLISAAVGTTLQGGAGDDVYIVTDPGIAVLEDAGQGDDEIRTSASVYSIAANGNIERLTYTGNGNSALTGNGANNTITGGAGDDVLIGGAGADTLVGGDGTDAASYATATAAVTINLNTGIHTGDAAGDTFDSIEVFNGTNYNDTFFATSSNDTFNGGAGADTINYSLSDASVNVNLSTNTYSGGYAAGDNLTGVERVVGTAFSDTLASSTAGHSLTGGAGDDIYVVGNQSITVTEASGGGDDEIQTNVTTYSMANYANIERLTYTGSANASLTGNSSNNIITGGIGNDTLRGGGGADTLIGGDGTDTASYSNATAAVTIDLVSGLHTGDAAGDSFDSIEAFTGSNYNDRFVASSGADILNGGAGTLDIIDYSFSAGAVSIDLNTVVQTGGDAAGDSLTGFESVVGSAFGDTLSSSTSSHNLSGGTGNDVYVIGNQGVTITENIGEGDDEVRTSLASFSIDSYANVERLSYVGTADATLVGNTGDNIIVGNVGNDTLSGGLGSDELIGGDGDDMLIGGEGADVLNGGSGVDGVAYLTSTSGVTVDLSAGTGLGGDAQGDSLTGIDSVIGSNFDDILSGAATGSLLEGSDGNDLIYGGSGTDTIYGGSGSGLMAGGDPSSADQADTLYGGDGNDVMYASGSGNNTASLLGNDSGTVIYGDGGDDTVYATDSIVYGGTGNDTISVVGGVAHGDTGDDVINGLGSGFQLYGGDGADSFHLSAGPGFVSGGEDGDTYYIDTILQSTVSDTGSAGTDYIYLNAIADISALQYLRDGNDLVISTVADFSDGVAESGVRVLDWYDGANNIEWFVTADAGTIAGTYFV